MGVAIVPMKEHVYRYVPVCLATMLISILASGCARTYKAPECPASEMAVIMAGSDDLAIVAVDELRTSLMRDSGRAQVAVLPGEHVIVVQHKRNGSVAEGSLTVDVRAGRTYRVKSVSKGYIVKFWIEEVPMKISPVI